MELTIAFIFVAPLIGMVSAYALMVAVYWLFRHSSPAKMDFYFRKFQLLSAASFSLSHGSNDAQKTMGIITGVLVASRFQKNFDIPMWVILAARTAIGLGTLSGGWRIVRTMGDAPDAPQTAQRILRRNRRGGRRAAGHPAWACRFPPPTPSPARSPAWAAFSG